MDRQPWFGRLTADQRAAVLLVTQRGVANFVAWLDEPAETIRLTAEAFRIAPRDLARRLSLRQTVELVRIATDVFEERLPPLAADDDEHRVLVEGVLRFGRGGRRRRTRLPRRGPGLGSCVAGARGRRAGSGPAVVGRASGRAAPPGRADAPPGAGRGAGRAPGRRAGGAGHRPGSARRRRRPRRLRAGTGRRRAAGRG